MFSIFAVIFPVNVPIIDEFANELTFEEGDKVEFTCPSGLVVQGQCMRLFYVEDEMWAEVLYDFVGNRPVMSIMPMCEFKAV